MNESAAGRLSHGGLENVLRTARAVTCVAHDGWPRIASGNPTGLTRVNWIVETGKHWILWRKTCSERLLRDFARPLV